MFLVLFSQSWQTYVKLTFPVQASVSFTIKDIHGPQGFAYTVLKKLNIIITLLIP